MPLWMSLTEMNEPAVTGAPSLVRVPPLLGSVVIKTALRLLAG